MGLDYSLHAVDPNLFRDRLIPYAMGRGDITDLIDQAVKLAAVRQRATTWRRMIVELHQYMTSLQEKIAPKVTYTYETIAEPTLADRMLGLTGRKKMESYEAPAFVPGMPGLDTDLHIWGRPFFNTAEGMPAVLATHRAFLALAGQPASKTEEMCRAMASDLYARCTQLPADLDKAVADAISKYHPYADTVQDVIEADVFDADDARRHYIADWNLNRTVWERRAEKAPYDIAAVRRESRIAAGLPAEIEDPAWIDVSENAGDPTEMMRASDGVQALPSRILLFAAELDPGWMGQGSAYASSSFAQIDMKVDDLFERPLALFAEMANAAPVVARVLTGDMYDGIGSYVPPQKVQQLVERLEKNRDRLVAAWLEKDANAYARQSAVIDYLKTLEPATYAASKGLGFLEAADIYSGYMGISN